MLRYEALGEVTRKVASDTLAQKLAAAGDRAGPDCSDEAAAAIYADENGGEPLAGFSMSHPYAQPEQKHMSLL